MGVKSRGDTAHGSPACHQGQGTVCFGWPFKGRFKTHELAPEGTLKPEPHGVDLRR